MPDSITNIGSYAFANTNLNEITLPQNLKEFSPNAFAFCESLQNIYINDENDKYVDIEGVVYTNDLKTIYSYPSGKVDDSYIVLDSVTNIGDYAFFSNFNLQSITLPSELITIG